MVKRKRRSATKTALIRAYIAENPEVTPKKIAELYGIPVKSVYQITYQMKKETKIPTAVDTTTGYTPEQTAELVYGLVSGKKHRMKGADIVATHHTDMVNHPPHYKAGGMETIDFIEAKELGYHLGNVIKYVSRADHKGNKLEDLKKAQWYLNRAIEKLN